MPTSSQVRASRWRNLCSCLFALSCLMVLANAAQAAQWARTYGGTIAGAVGVSGARSALPTADRGYVVAGYTTSFGVGAYDVWVLKLDAEGNVGWQRTYGVAIGTFEGANSIQSTADGGYIAVGRSPVPGTSFGDGALVLRLDAGGNVVWQKLYANGGFANAVQVAAGGGYLVVGVAAPPGGGGYDAWVLKMDDAGDVIWQRTYGSANTDWGTSVQPTADGGWIIAGTSQPPGTGILHAWVLKLDGAGNVIWHKTYGGTGDYAASAIQPTTDGGYIVTGHARSSPAVGDDAWVLKLGATGDITWQKTYGGPRHDYASSIQATADGGYIVAGSAGMSDVGPGDAWVLRLGASGDIIWQRTYGGPGLDEVYSIQPTTDGGYIAAGTTNSFGAGEYDAWLLKLDADGAITGCASMGTLNATSALSNASARDGTATIASTSLAPEGGTLSTGNTSAVLRQLCYYDGGGNPVPGLTGIPTLSDWALISLASLIAVLGFVFARQSS